MAISNWIVYLLLPKAGCVVCACPNVGVAVVEPKRDPDCWVVPPANKDEPGVPPNTGAANPVFGLKADCAPNGELAVLEEKPAPVK